MKNFFKIIALLSIFVFSSSASAGNIMFKWYPNPIKEKVIEYVLYYYVENTSNINNIIIPVADLDINNPTFIMKNVTDGCWCFSLTAKNLIGESAKTPEICIFIGVPGVPNNFIVEVEFVIND